MLKKSLGFLLLLLFAFLTGCQDTGTTDPDQLRFSLLDTMLASDPLEVQNGYDYSLVQKVGNDVVHTLTVTQRIDRQSGLKIMTETEETSLGHFGSDSSPRETVRYFDGSRIGIQAGNEAVVWEAGTLTAYGENRHPLNSFEETDFLTSGFTTAGSATTFSAELRPESIPGLLGTASDVLRSTLTIVFSESARTLTSISVTMVQEASTITITYVPYYPTATVLLP